MEGGDSREKSRFPGRGRVAEVQALPELNERTAKAHAGQAWTFYLKHSRFQPTGLNNGPGPHSRC